LLVEPLLLEHLAHVFAAQPVLAAQVHEEADDVVLVLRLVPGAPSGAALVARALITVALITVALITVALITVALDAGSRAVAALTPPSAARAQLSGLSFALRGGGPGEVGSPPLRQQGVLPALVLLGALLLALVLVLLLALVPLFEAAVALAPAPPLAAGPGVVTPLPALLALLRGGGVVLEEGGGETAAPEGRGALLRLRARSQVGPQQARHDDLRGFVGEQAPRQAQVVRVRPLGAEGFREHVHQVRLLAGPLLALGGQLTLDREDLVGELEHVQVAHVLGRDQRDRRPRAARAPGAPRAVHVVLRRLGEVRVDDVSQMG